MDTDDEEDRRGSVLSFRNAMERSKSPLADAVAVGLSWVLILNTFLVDDIAWFCPVGSGLIPETTCAGDLFSFPPTFPVIVVVGIMVRQHRTPIRWSTEGGIS